MCADCARWTNGVAQDGRVIASEIFIFDVDFRWLRSIKHLFMRNNQTESKRRGASKMVTRQTKWSSLRERNATLFFFIYFDRIWRRRYLMESHRPMQTIFPNNFNYAVEASHPIIIIFVWKCWVYDVRPVRIYSTWKCLALFTRTHPMMYFDRFSRPQSTNKCAEN